MAVSGQELSECTSHLVEYAANRGFSRITQIARIIGGVMVVGGNCLNCDFCDLVICLDFCGTKRLIGTGKVTARGRAYCF